VFFFFNFLLLWDSYIIIIINIIIKSEQFPKRATTIWVLEGRVRVFFRMHDHLSTKVQRTTTILRENLDLSVHASIVHVHRISGIMKNIEASCLTFQCLDLIFNVIYSYIFKSRSYNVRLVPGNANRKNLS